MEEVPEIHEVADNSEFQLDDDYSLLDLIIKDMETSEVLYQPTMYWKKYTTEAVELLRGTAASKIQFFRGGCAGKV